jgi:hypothetical protein
MSRRVARVADALSAARRAEPACSWGGQQVAEHASEPWVTTRRSSTHGLTHPPPWWRQPRLVDGPQACGYKRSAAILAPKSYGPVLPFSGRSNCRYKSPAIALGPQFYWTKPFFTTSIEIMPSPSPAYRIETAMTGPSERHAKPDALASPSQPTTDTLGRCASGCLAVLRHMLLPSGRNAR